MPCQPSRVGCWSAGRLDIFLRCRTRAPPTRNLRFGNATAGAQVRCKTAEMNLACASWWKVRWYYVNYQWKHALWYNCINDEYKHITSRVFTWHTLWFMMQTNDKPRITRINLQDVTMSLYCTNPCREICTSFEAPADFHAPPLVVLLPVLEPISVTTALLHRLVVNDSPNQ